MQDLGIEDQVYLLIGLRGVRNLQIDQHVVLVAINKMVFKLVK